MDIGVGATVVVHSVFKGAKNAVNAIRGNQGSSTSNRSSSNMPSPYGPTIVFAQDQERKARRKIPRKAKLSIVAAIAIVSNWGCAPQGKNIIGSVIPVVIDGGPIAGINDVGNNISNSAIANSISDRFKFASQRRIRDLINGKLLAGDILYDGEAVPFNFDVYSVEGLPSAIQKFNEIFPGWFLYEAKRIESETQIPWAVIAAYQMANCSDANDVGKLAACLNAAVTDEPSRLALVGNMQGFAENLRNRVLSADPKSEQGLYQFTAKILAELGRNPADVKQIFSSTEMLIAFATFNKRTDLSYAIKPSYLVNVNGTLIHKDMAKSIESLVGEATADGISLDTTSWIPIIEIRNRRLACFAGKDLTWEERVRLIWEAKPGAFAKKCGVNPLPIPGQGVHMDGRAVDFTCSNDSNVPFGQSECNTWLEQRRKKTKDPIVFSIGDTKLQTSSATPWELRMAPTKLKALEGVIGQNSKVQARTMVVGD